MLENSIIAFIVGGAFVRAGHEYGKNGLAWGAIGLAAFFGPSLLIPFLVTFILTLAGASPKLALGSFTLTGLLGFATGLAATVWTYNKLMERAIDAQAAKDTRDLAAAAAQTPV
jgi:hypothetical protein